MFNIISQWNYKGVPRPILNWDRMIESIGLRFHNYYRRVQFGVLPITPWTNLLKRLLNKIPINELMTYNKGAEQYAHILYAVVPMMEQMLTPGYQLTVRNNVFISSNNNVPVQEYIIPCRSVTPLLDLPIGEGIEEWKKVDSVHMLFNDSLELGTSLQTGLFKYEKEQPNEVIVSINCIALAMQYFIYCEASALKKYPRSQDKFIQDFILHSLYKDIVRCWALTLLNTSLYGQTRTVYLNNSMVNDALVNNALNTHQHFINNIECMAYSSGDYLDTKWFLKSSVNDYIKEIRHNVTLPPLRHNAHIRFMIEYPILRMIISLNRLAGRSENMNMNKQLGIVLRRFRIANIFIHCNFVLREKLKTELDELIQLTQADDILPAAAAGRDVNL